MRPPVRLLKIYRDKKRRAASLRKRGYSYLEIAQALNISKSTVYDWTKLTKLSRNARLRINKKLKEAFRRGLAVYNTVIRPQEAAKIREEIKEKASKEIKSLSLKDLKLVGSALYWAEGNTKNRNRLQFGNSNPLMIKVFMRFFRKVCNIQNNKIKARIHLYQQTNRQKALNFWCRITNLPKNNFYAPQIQISRNSKRKRPKNILPYGTLHLTVLNTGLACRVKGWIQGIAEKI